MSAGSFVLLAVVAGELATIESVDAALGDISPSRHHDPTWTELSDALLDQRNAIIKVNARKSMLVAR
jgi:hypothetical protein